MFRVQHNSLLKTNSLKEPQAKQPIFPKDKNTVDDGFESDYQAYCKFLESLRDLLPKRDLDRIWQDAIRNSCPCASPTEKHTLAIAFAEDCVLNKVDDVNTSEGNVTPSSSASKKEDHVNKDSCQHHATSSSHYEQFLQVFGDFLHIQALQSIWDELDCTVTEEEKLEIASIFAFDTLREQSQHFPPTRKHTPFKSNKQRNKKSVPLTPQQECINFILLIFEKEKLVEFTVKLALQDRGYDVEKTVEHFCMTILKKGCFIRPNVSFVDAVLSNPENIELTNSSKLKAAEIIEQVEGKSILDRVKPPPCPKSTTEYELNARVLEHIFKPKNPHIKCSVSKKGEFVYEGTREQFSRDIAADMYLLSIRIDLHGLTVYHSLRIVESCMAYYYSAEEQGRLWGRMGTRKIMLVLIVGKGLHSNGQRARIGPAIIKFLQEWQINDYVYYEGEVTVQLKI